MGQALCVKLGEWKDNGISAGITLPGTKMRVGELAVDSMERLLQNDLSLFKARINMEAPRIESQEKPSESYGIPTKYSKTVFHATLGDVTKPRDDVAKMDDNGSSGVLVQPTRTINVSAAIGRERADTNATNESI